MFEGLSVSAVDLSAAGLLALAVLLMFMGGLIPRWVVNQIREDRDKRLSDSREEINNWKTAFLASEERNRLQSVQLGELMELGKTTDAFIRSLQLAARRNDNS